MIVYIAGPYSGDIDTNIQAAREVAATLWEDGFAVICPHLNTAHFERDCRATYDDYIAGDLQIVARCDVVVMLPGWEESRGARKENAFAHTNGIPVVLWPARPVVSPTETRYPEQVKGFIRLIMQAYRVHLKKNEDYSTANVDGPGALGIVVRIWDKTVRLMNLHGFPIRIVSRQMIGGIPGVILRIILGLTYKAMSWAQVDEQKPASPNFESIEDGFMDLTVYGIIGQLFRAGKWGK